MRTLKYAILGLLYHKSMTGYELMQQFESALEEFWSAKHSQIYPELKKLTEEGMVSFEVVISGTALEKKLYTITEKGSKDFLLWLAKEEEMQTTQKDVFRLRLFFSNLLEPNERTSLIRHELEQHVTRLEKLRENKARYTEIPDKESNEFSDYLVLMGACMREEKHCEWLKKCLELCKA